MKILGIDPGENCGFAVADGSKTSKSTIRVQRAPILWMGATIEAAKAYLSVNGLPDVVVIEDQYAGKASARSVTTLSQRAGYLAGVLGLPPEITWFVMPRTWYKAVGMPNHCTKAVCMNRIQLAMLPAERAVLETICEVTPARRFDVTAAVGIAWSWPHVPASSKRGTQKLKVFTAKPLPKRQRRVKKKS